MNARWKTVVVAVAALAGIAATCALGAWQLRRAAGKTLLEQQMEAAAGAPPSTPDAAGLADPHGLAHRHLRFTGRWLPDRVVYLDNRPQDGRVGLYVLMALHIDEPLATDIIVNRGWLPRDPRDRARIADYATPSGPVVVTGVALDDEQRLMELAAPGSRPLGTIWQNFDFDAFARASGASPVRLVLRQDAGSDDGLARSWPDRGGAIQAQIDRHHGYAFQWFALAATIAALLGYRIVRGLIHADRRHDRHPILESDV